MNIKCDNCRCISTGSVLRIKCSEELPPYEKRVLLWFRRGGGSYYSRIGCRKSSSKNGEHYLCEGNEWGIDNATHWCELPPDPEDE